MKKFYLFLLLIILSPVVFGTQVPVDKAQQIALGYYQHFTGHQPDLKNVSVTTCRGLETFYTFRFEKGFVIVSADDAVIPVLGYSFENDMPDQITNPATAAWLDSYSREIYQVVNQHLDNRLTSRQWDELLRGNYPAPQRDVTPLLTTTWDQGCNYNALCPADPSAFFSCGHVYTGCVATAMAQIMKYHNYPAQGVGSHSYTHPTYGVQTADFGNTMYNWSSMPNNVTGSNSAVATLMYHAGVSVDMQYGASASGAFSTDVPPALLDYFNYHPDIMLKNKSDYPVLEDFKNLIRADLDQHLPVYYSGQGPDGGHAFVCDGYRMSDGTFHFNWGWSGSSNGYYTIGALNPGGYTFNDNNSVVVHIKPYNSSLVVRITHPVNNAIVGVGNSVEIKAMAIRGNPSSLKIFIDNVEKASGSGDSLIFIWQTANWDLGSHEVRACAYTATDTVYYKINLNVAEWISQASGFSTANRQINYMSAVDSSIVWAVAVDANNPQGASSDFTRTVDGGNTWTPGTITGTTGLASAMIFGMNADKAYAAMFKVSGTAHMGIYFTSDGGATWSRQTTAGFNNANSFPNCVHFFNENDGWCMGDPISGDFEIYTTTDGGTTWTQVSGSDIPNPVTGEFGVVGYYSAINDTLWFGTNKGRVYRSCDKGYTWTVSTVPALDGKFIKPTFRTGLHGLVQDKDAGSTGAISETFDGGNTWTPVTVSGPIYPTDLSYVPGTANTWVSSGSLGTNGCSYSFDGGHTWADFIGTNGTAYWYMTWVNNHCGWAGGVNTTVTEDGTFKYIGLLRIPLPSPANFLAEPTQSDVHMTWEKPTFDSTIMTLHGYNLYRNGVKLNPTLLAGRIYDDMSVPSDHYNYCVSAVYDLGESDGNCQIIDITVGMDEKMETRISVYPNPVHDKLFIRPEGNVDVARLMDLTGHLVATAKGTTVDVSGIAPGLYVLEVNNQRVKVVVE
ncbi:MAG: C10 family peptidase [Syntrophothermus sp.]